MSTIVICRLDQIAQAAVHHGAREMISLMAEGHTFHRPGVIAASRHLNLALNDIVQTSPGLTAPGEAHVERIIRFAREWDQSAPLLVHCWMGISRSPAAALIAALAVAPDQDDRELALRLRKTSPFVTPNIRLIKIGDTLLGREGRLYRAVEAIGRGEETSQGDCFRFVVRPDEDGNGTNHG